MARNSNVVVNLFRLPCRFTVSF